MDRFLRYLLIALLVASLPLRGVSAAMMLAGVGEHVADARQAAHEHGMHAQQPQHDAHPLAMQAEHVDHAAAAHGEHAHHAASAHHADDPQPRASGSCGPCGDCCSVGAPGSLPILSRVEAPVTRVFALTSPQPASFFADLPVPPPNPLAA